MLKESKIRVLENFYALDYVFFGKPVAKVESCCPLVKEEYLSIKGALLSVFVEMLKLVDHTPTEISEQVDSKLLKSYARKNAKIARENAQRIVASPKSRQNIKESLKAKIKEDKNLDISAMIEGEIRQKAFALAVDNLLLARVVSESKSFKKLNEWQGTIIEDSYKILRDNLIESAYEIIYSEIEEVEESAASDSDALEKLNELHSPELLKEFFEFSGFLSSVSDHLLATYKSCSQTKCHKSAGVSQMPFNRQRAACTDMCWVAALKKGIATLNSGKSRCKTARNPEKCVARFDKLVKLYNRRIKDYTDRAKNKIAKAKK